MVPESLIVTTLNGEQSHEKRELVTEADGCTAGHRGISVLGPSCFIQLSDDCNGVYVQRQADGFEVRELRAGSSGARFTYRVVAKRRGFETARLAGISDMAKLADGKSIE